MTGTVLLFILCPLSIMMAMRVPQLGSHPQESSTPIVVAVLGVHEVSPIAEGGHEADRGTNHARARRDRFDFLRRGKMRERVALRVWGDRSVMASSRPVKLTGWKLRKLMVFGLWRAN